MNHTHQDICFADLDWNGVPIRLEYQWVGATASRYPVIVFLHDGLGSVAMWQDFPQRFCAEHGFQGLVFSRYGHGQSTARGAQEGWPINYLHQQAHEALPAFLSQLGVQRPWLFGHSDGGSIALLYAARFPQAVSGLVVMAPHIFVEDCTIDGVCRAQDAFMATDLAATLARYHADAHTVFWGWNDVWLNPAFYNWNIEDQLAAITCPVLALQGEQNEYGSLQQIEQLQKKAPNARAIALPQCGHAPHRDQPRMVSNKAANFIKESS